MSTKEQRERIELPGTLDLLILRALLLGPAHGLMAKGRRQLAAETRRWDKLAGAIARILQSVEREGES
jgi:hypothetical protein